MSGPVPGVLTRNCMRAIEQLQEWAYTGEALVPLKGFPGVVWQRSKKKKRAGDDPFSLGRAGQP